MEQYMPLIVSALGGVILGPLVARLTGGSGTGGVLGGVAAHFGANSAGLGQLLGDTAMMAHVQDFLEGGVGGGILAVIAGAVMKKS